MIDSEIKKIFVQDLNRVKNALVAASEHFNIHYILTNAIDRPKYVNVMEHYLGFFSASISAQFTSALLTLSKVLDENTKNNKISIYSLVQMAETHNLIEVSKLKEIKDELKSTHEPFKKLQILRNNQFAHLGNLDSVNAFKHAAITPNRLKSLIDSSIRILQKIYYSYDRNEFPFDYYAKRDTYLLLNDLLQMHKF